MTQQEINQFHTLANESKGFTFIGKEPIDTSKAKGFEFSGTLDFEPAPIAKTFDVRDTYPLFIFGLVVALIFWTAIVALSR